MAKTLLITGSSRGIGAATALLAAERGYNLCINYRSNERAAQEVLRKVLDLGISAIMVQADIAKEEEVIRLFKTVDEGLGRLDGLVNNAGTLVPARRVDEMTAERLSKVFQTNVVGSFLCAREAIKRMSTRYGGKGGAIVNVSSAASRTGSAGVYVDYAASKGALDTFSYGLAQELAQEGIRVNAVRPGFIDTEIHSLSELPGRAEQVAQSVPMRRNGAAEEVATAILWLLSEEASYTSGAWLDVAGAR